MYSDRSKIFAHAEVTIENIGNHPSEVPLSERVVGVVLLQRTRCVEGAREAERRNELTHRSDKKHRPQHEVTHGIYV